MNEGKIMKYRIPKLETMSDEYLAVCGSGSYASGGKNSSCNTGDGTQTVCQLGSGGFQGSPSPCLGGGGDSNCGLRAQCGVGNMEGSYDCTNGTWDNKTSGNCSDGLLPLM